ncbi:PAS domain S-box protein [Bacillus sp. B15-48]|uniref:PAS domain S-box protein n=1 Tax=Bacillus sp. B15-48 TaxID=1548601 RepID=UPI00193FD158|nr:PAS domain S-box protein [Bacillus sp. B15-48]
MENPIVNILLVDDREENLLALEAVLTSPQYNLIKAHSGEEALKWILKEEFAVIIMDVQMPGMNGFETAKMIRRREKSMDVPIIFVTALSQTFENVLQGYSVGAIDYIIKPFDAFILNSKVNGFVSLFLNQKKVEEQAKIIAERTEELEKANLALQKSEEKLERLVKERTAELAKTNDKLKIEINEKQKTLRQLEESMQRYQSLFDYHPDAVFSCDLDGKFMSVNDAMVKVTGWSREELLKISPLSLLNKKDEKKVVYHFKASRNGKTQDYDLQIMNKRKELVDIQVKNIPIVVDNKVIGVYGIAKDISVEKKLWKQLLQSEEQYRQLVEESPEAIILKKENYNNWSFVNQTGVQLLKAMTKEEITSRPLLDFIHPDDHIKVKNSRPINDDGHYSFECRFICLNGDIIDVEVNAIPIVYDGDSYLHIMVRDITELKQSREFIQQTEKLTVVGELAAGIAHEIRNPLTSLKGFTQLLEDKADCNPEYMEIMITEIERINTIVSELLLLTKPKMLEFRQIEIRHVFDNIITLMSAQANLYGVTIQLKMNASIDHLILYGVENKLKQVFINIIKNAIEATEDGGNIIVEIKQHGNDIEFQFVDGGCGISSEVLSKLGKPFFTTKENGTGLGLMVCYSIIKSHQGTMVIDSVVGEGTKVTIRLPLYQRNSKSLEYLLE